MGCFPCHRRLSRGTVPTGGNPRSRLFRPGLTALLLFLLPGAPATAQTPDREALPRSSAGDLPVAQAVPLEGRLVLDGILDEPAWQKAPPVTQFTQLDPLEGQPGSEETVVYFLYDDHYLYVGAVLKDRHPVSTRLGRRDGFLLDSDWFTVSFDTYNDNRSGFKFEVNPSGVRGDEALSGGQDRRGDSSWDPVWEAATHIGEDGWSVEIRIPFSQLRFPNQEEQVWGLQIVRDIARNREKQLFSFTPKSQPGGIARYGDLVGLRGIRQSRGLEVLPYLQGRAEFVAVPQNPGVPFRNPFRDGSDLFHGAGVDLKYRLFSNLTLDATFNPDFGQVELDPAVVNLTAFETRYEEKRPFFVEGAGIFSFGQGGGEGGGGGMMGGGGGGGGGGEGGGGPAQLLYTRRIGAPPPGSVPDEAVYTRVPDVATILGAAKLTGRTAGGWSLGFLEAVTGREQAAYVDAFRNRKEVEVAPLTNFVVGRAKRDLRQGQSSVGFLATAVHRDLGDGRLAQTLRSSAFAGGVDFLHQWSGRTWAVSGQVAASRIAGEPAVIESAQRSSARYFQRPDATHLEVDPTATSLSGYSARLRVGREAGMHWTGHLRMDITSPGFEVNDLGFQRDADRMELGGQLEYQENRPGDRFRRYEISLSPGATWNFAGDRLGTSLALRANFTFLNYWSTNLNYRREFPSLDDRLTRGGPLAATPASHQASVTVSSDFSKPYSGMGSLSYQWDEAGGARTTVWGRISMKPSSTVDLSLGPRLTLNRSAAQYVTRITDTLATATFGRRYIFADLRQTTLSIDTRLNVTFAPDLTLELFAQPFLASGDYGVLKELARPGRFEFSSYGLDKGTVTLDAKGNATVDPDGNGPARAFTVTNRDFNRVSLRGTAVLRWEWRAGSTLYLVWQQSRSDAYADGDFDLGREARAMFKGKADNIFMVKATYWIGS